MNILYYLKHWLQTKIYNAVIGIQAEREIARMKEILNPMILHGKPLHMDRGYSILGSKYMEFGDSCWFGDNACVECIDDWKGNRYSPSLKVGDRFSMQKNCHIGCIESIEIGDNVLLGSKVYITDHYHGEITAEALEVAPFDRPLWSKPVKIGSGCWIGDNVCIMPGVTLGDNVIVGANAVVTHRFPANTVIAGVPARIIKML